MIILWHRDIQTTILHSYFTVYFNTNTPEMFTKHITAYANNEINMADGSDEENVGLIQRFH